MPKTAISTGTLIPACLQGFRQTVQPLGRGREVFDLVREVREIEHPAFAADFFQFVAECAAPIPAPVFIYAVAGIAKTSVYALLQQFARGGSADRFGVAAHESDVLRPLLDDAGYIHDHGGSFRCCKGAERAVRSGDSHDEAFRAAFDLALHRLSREFMDGAKDGKLPAVAFAQMFEDAVELVLSGDTGHAQSDGDSVRTVDFHSGQYSKNELRATREVQ